MAERVGPLRLATKTARELAASWCMEAPDDHYVTIEPHTRSLSQNARMWAILTDISEQLKWRDWQQREITMSPEEWKDFLTATFRREQRMVMGEDGASFVLVGSRTKTMGVAEMSEFQTFCEAFATGRGVTLKDNVVAIR